MLIESRTKNSIHIKISLLYKDHMYIYSFFVNSIYLWIMGLQVIFIFSLFSFFKYLFIYLFIYFFKIYLFYLFIYLFLAVLGLRFVRGPSLVAASGGHSSSRCGDRSSSRCAGLSLSRPLLLRGTGSRRAGSAAVAHGPSRSAACGILPDQGSNPCLLH